MGSRSVVGGHSVAVTVAVTVTVTVTVCFGGQEGKQKKNSKHGRRAISWSGVTYVYKMASVFLACLPAWTAPCQAHVLPQPSLLRTSIAMPVAP